MKMDIALYNFGSDDVQLKEEIYSLCSQMCNLKSTKNETLDEMFDPIVEIMVLWLKEKQITCDQFKMAREKLRVQKHRINVINIDSIPTLESIQRKLFKIRDTIEVVPCYFFSRSREVIRKITNEDQKQQASVRDIPSSVDLSSKFCSSSLDLLRLIEKYQSIHTRHQLLISRIAIIIRNILSEQKLFGNVKQGFTQAKIFRSLYEKYFRMLVKTVYLVTAEEFGIRFLIAGNNDDVVTGHPEDCLDIQGVNPVITMEIPFRDIILGECYIYSLSNRQNQSETLAIIREALKLAVTTIVYAVQGLMIRTCLEEIISKTIEAKDPYTGQHSKLVGFISGYIAREFKQQIADLKSSANLSGKNKQFLGHLLGDEYVDKISDGKISSEIINELDSWDLANSIGITEFAGRLHDIGKINVATETLRDDLSYDIFKHISLQSHTYFSRSILNDIFSINSTESVFKKIMYACELHHVADLKNRHYIDLDGNAVRGKPVGMKYSKLIEIVRLADILHALLSDRPYRRAWAFGQVVNCLVLHLHGEIPAQVAFTNFMSKKSYIIQALKTIIEEDKITFHFERDIATPITQESDLRLFLLKKNLKWICSQITSKTNANSEQIIWLLNNEKRNPFSGTDKALIELLVDEYRITDKFKQFLYDRAIVPKIQEADYGQLSELLIDQVATLLHNMCPDKHPSKASVLSDPNPQKTNEYKKQELNRSVLETVYFIEKYIARKTR